MPPACWTGCCTSRCCARRWSATVRPSSTAASTGCRARWPPWASRRLGTSFRFGGGFRYVVSVIFLVLSPPEPPEPHLELVSAIASFVRDSQALDGLKAAASPEQAVRALAAP